MYSSKRVIGYISYYYNSVKKINAIGKHRKIINFATSK